MAEETPVSPINAAEPPKADPLGKPVTATGSTLKLSPVVRKPVAQGATAALRPGLKLPPKPGATVSALRPGLKLPSKPGAATQTALKPGLKLPPKPAAATQSALKPGLNLPPKPGVATQTALKPGLNLPPRPQIRKPGESVAAKPIPKPVAPVAVPETAEVPRPEEKPVAPVAKVDALGVTKLPTVEMQAVNRDEPIVTPEPPKPMEALKSVTQKLKGITQSIPQQAILHKTGIIADVATSDAQKEAAKHKTARISLADAIGAAPVKNENAPMKTIRIKRPVGIPGAVKTDAPKPAEPEVLGVEAEAKTSSPAAEPAPSVTQRKTLKISRPGTGAVRPAGKFGIKRPGAAAPVAPAPKKDGGEGSSATPAGEVADIPEIADIPPMPAFSAPVASAPASNDGPAWLCALSAAVQLAACLAIGVLAWYLYQNTQVATF